MAKRTALSLLAALLAAGMLCACAAQPASTAEEAAQPAQTEQQPQSQPAEAEALAEEEQAQEALAEEEPEEQPVQVAEVAPTQDENGVWCIASPKGLAMLREQPEEKYRLTADIDLAGAQWSPAGDSSKPFTGTLDGDGHTVSNFTVPDGEKTGFFGVMNGTVRNLTLENASFAVESGTLGGLAAEAAGTFEACTVSGAMSVGGSATAGGLVGKLTGGSLTGCTADVRIDAQATAAVGLLAGSLEAGTVEGCVYAGNWNVKNGELFTDLAASNAGASVTNCLWRDNRNSDELLSENAQALRQRVLDYSYAEGTLEWSPSRDLMFVCSCGSALHRQEFKTGETYYGIPYTHKQGSLERFHYCFDENGDLKDWVPDLGYDGFDMYIGNDCSGSIYWAWAQVSDSINFKWTYTMLPEYGCGVVKVGEYYASETTTPPMIEKNSKETILEAYAQLHAADAIVTYHSGENHARLCTQPAVVLRDQTGAIDTEASYLVVNSQGDGISENVDHSTWVIDRKYTFEEIYEHYYVPITVQELADGKAPEAEVSIDDQNEGAAYLCAGTITSNYRINAVTATIQNADGSDLWEQTIFTGIGKWESVESDMLLRETIKTFRMADFAQSLTTAMLEHGNSYHYTINVLLSDGQTYPVKSFDFSV